MSEFKNQEKYNDEKKEIKVRPDNEEDKLKLSRANDMIGREVKNLDDEKLGKIDDIIVDINHGQYSYAVVASGGFLGIGEKFIAVPWDILEFNPADNTFILKIHHDKLENAPDINTENWPIKDDKNWMVKFINYYNLNGYYSGVAAHNLRDQKGMVNSEIDYKESEIKKGKM